MIYNKRSAVRVASWFGKAGKRMAHHRVLELLYKSTWVEALSPSAFGQNPLKVAKEYRDSAWWACLLIDSQEDSTVRHGRRHRKAGHQRFSWEHPFVIAFDEAWRGKLGLFTSLAEWMRGCGHFINTICKHWGLPGLCQQELETKPECPMKVRISIDEHLLPALPRHPFDRKWQSTCRRIWMQTDCRAIAELASGRAVRDRCEMRLVFQRISRYLLRLHQLGWSPLQDVDDFVQLSPRMFNCIADCLAVAMNAERDPQVIDQEAFQNIANVRLCVDGGDRKSVV